jgi:hypothetical protein
MNDLLNVGPSKSQPQAPLLEPLSFEMSTGTNTGSQPTIKNEFWTSSFQQTDAGGDANILQTLHNHQRGLDGKDEDSMWNLHLDYEPVE